MPFFRNAVFFVEFFFVLSGFVMLHTYGRTSFSKEKFKDYILNRFFRLYPMHLLMLIAAIGFEFFKLYAQGKGLGFNHAAFTDSGDPAYIFPSLLLIHAWISEPAALSFNVPSWSISIEFYIYIILGLTLFRASKVKNFVFAFIVLLAFVSLMANSRWLTEQALRGLFGFFTGCFAYIIYKKLPDIHRSKNFFTIVELMLVVLIIVTLSSAFPFNYKGIVSTLLFAVTIIIFAMEKGAISSILKLRFFTYLGKLSYSIYITHYLLCALFVAAAVVLSKVTGNEFTIVDHSGPIPIRFITTRNFWGDQLIVFALLAIVIIVSSFTYKYVELKGIAKGKQFRSKYAVNKNKTVTQQPEAVGQ